MKRATAAAWLLATVGLLTLSAASAQTYPTQSIRIIGPSSPAGGTRAKSLPGLPAVAETLPGVEVSAWYGVLAPAGTPHEIISKLHAETVKAIASPKVMQQISNAGAKAVSSTPEEFSAYIKAELARWGKAIKATGLPPE